MYNYGLLHFFPILFNTPYIKVGETQTIMINKCPFQIEEGGSDVTPTKSLEFFWYEEYFADDTLTGR